MSKFISFEETCALLGIMDFEIFDSLQEGLHIYSRYGNPKRCPGNFHRFKILQERQIHILKPSQIEEYLPDDHNSEDSILPNYNSEDHEKAKFKALEFVPEKLKDEFLENEKEMSKIIKDDPNLISWTHFNKEPYCDGEIRDLITEIKDDGLFKLEEVAVYKDRIKKGDVAKRKEEKKVYMFTMAGPQVEKLYSIFLSEFTSWPSEDPKKMHEFVINAFKKDRGSFNFIKIDYLRDEKLYEFYRERHAREDFIGRLFVKIAPDFGLNIKNAQTIYGEYKIFKKMSTKVD